MLHEKSLGSVRIISVDHESLIHTLQKKSISIKAENPDIIKILLFGSFSKGNFLPESDIDILLIVKSTDIPFLERKESFRPFATEKFYVYPPWCEETVVEPLISMVIEPGMAFGTGQHATTQLCLQQIEGHEYTPASRSLDVGTGTGILSIAMKQLGCGHVDATDIDPDAIIACRENARGSRGSR